MTVEIVNPEPDPSVRKQIICKNCGAALSYVPADVERRISCDYTGDPTQRDVIDCPKCKAEVKTRGN